MTGDWLELSALAAVAAVLVLFILSLGEKKNDAAERARAVVRAAADPAYAAGGDAEETADEPGLRERATKMMIGWGQKLPLFNPKQRKQVQDQLLTAGFRHPHALSIYVATKLAGGAVGVVAGVVLGRSLDVVPLVAVIMVMGGLQVGMLGPEIALRRRVVARRQAIHRSLPDALDLMVICTNAGYSLGATIRRLALELAEISPALANELEVTSHEIQMSGDPVSGLRNLAERTGVPSLRAMVATLVQAHQYGTPITQSLKTLARGERTTRILTLEEKGAKLAAKMTMPMMLLILPAVMLVSGAPAFLRLMESMK